MSGIRSREGVCSAVLLVWFFFAFHQAVSGRACVPMVCWFHFSAVYLLLSVRYLKMLGSLA